MSKKKDTSKQKAVAMLLAMTLAFTFCWGMSALKAEAHSNSVTKTWYYNPNTKTFKPFGNPVYAAMISLSSGASDRAHISAVITKPDPSYERATVGQQFEYNTTKYFDYLDSANAGGAYYIVGMHLTTDSLATSVTATYTFAP